MRKKPALRVAFLVSMIGMATIAEVAEKDRDGHWEHYAEEHHCRRIGRRVATTLQPEQTIYICEGGDIIESAAKLREKL